MKLIILPLIIASIGVAQARVYKCPEKLAGRYIYQEKPCSKEAGAADKNKVNIIPTDKKRVKAAVEKMNKDIEAHQAEKEKRAKAANKNQTEINVTIPPREKSTPVSTKKEKEGTTTNQESSSNDNNEGG